MSLLIGASNSARAHSSSKAGWDESIAEISDDGTSSADNESEVETPVGRMHLARHLAMSRLVAVSLGALLGLVAGLAWMVSAAPTGYTATATAFVGFKFSTKQDDPFGGSLFIKQRIDSYAQLATSPQVVNAVAAELGVRDKSALRSSIDVSATPGTVLLSVAVKDQPTAEEASAAANAVVSNLDTAVVGLEGDASKPRTSPVAIILVQPAIAAPASRGKSQYIAPALGLVVGAGLGFLVNSAYRRRRAPADARSTLHERPTTSSDGSTSATAEASVPSAFDFDSVFAPLMTPGDGPASTDDASDGSPSESADEDKAEDVPVSVPSGHDESDSDSENENGNDCDLSSTPEADGPESVDAEPDSPQGASETPESLRSRWRVHRRVD